MISFEKEEHIILEVRKHWFIFFMEIVLSIILLLLPILISPLFSYLGIQIDSYSISIYFFLYSLWALLIWMFIFVLWTNYFLDVWIVTNQKIIDVEQHGLFSREVSMLHYESIQDVSYEVHGLLAALLGFGTLHVQTAGTEKLFTISGIPNPEYVQRKINELLLKSKIKMN